MVLILDVVIKFIAFKKTCPFVMVAIYEAANITDTISGCNHLPRII